MRGPARYDRSVIIPMRRLAAAFVATALSVIPATAHAGTSLQRVAEQVGYAYAWSASASEVTLSRPGLTIVLRPGNRRWQINDRVAYASQAPVYENGDLSVPADVTAELRALAGRYPVSRATEGTRIGPVTNPALVNGSLTLALRAVTGRDAIAVDGIAPGAVPGSPISVTLTLTGTLSRDLPTVTLQRVTLATDGTFHTTLALAGLPRGSVVTVTATSLSGLAPASAHLTVGAPNPGVDSPLDHLPKD
jgi:copper amine oxidase-like protein